ncbi:hypothetical protein MKY53_05205 [Macrococcus sp. FSL R5-0951]
MYSELINYFTDENFDVVVHTDDGKSHKMLLFLGEDEYFLKISTLSGVMHIKKEKIVSMEYQDPDKRNF